MAQKKKLQVFVSSTYEDLRAERQAAVEAILTAGHIPAGMELFTAGDQSQMQVIHRWIAESDVFLLILGGRYGSIEPQSQKSYIHLEYDYALAQNKPLFAVVITDAHLDEKVKTHGIEAMEREHTEKYIDFKNIVRTRLVRFWSNPDQIKLAIHESMREFIDRPGVIGWVPSNEASNTGPALEELVRLTRENATLKEQLASYSKETTLYNGLSYSDMYSLLHQNKLDVDVYSASIIEKLEHIAKIFGDKYISHVHLLFLSRHYLLNGELEYEELLSLTRGTVLGRYGLIACLGIDSALTSEGRKFLLKLMTEDEAQAARASGL